jgi:hypothetical protein
MHWRRVAIDERLEIVREQLYEQLACADSGLAEWLESQINALLAAADTTGERDYVERETGLFRALTH